MNDGVSAGWVARRIRPGAASWSARRGPLPLLLFILAMTASVAGRARGAPAPASAPGAPASAATAFERGARAYDGGRFEEAIANFEQAYALDPAPILLFNIAQAYRRLGKAEQALAYYRRYRDLAPANAPDRADAERRIIELERASAPGGATAASAGQRASASPPTPLSPPARASQGPPAAAPAGVSVKVAPAGDVSASETAPGERRWRVGVDAGAAFLQFHGSGYNHLASFTVRAVAGYRFGSGPTLTEVGVAASVTRIGYHYSLDGTNEIEKQSALVGGAARLEVNHALSPRINLVGELLAGVTWWAGLGAGNPFTGDYMVTGALPVPWTRLGIGLHYHLVPQTLFVYVQPAFAFYKPLQKALSDNLSSLTAVDLPIGIGYVF